MHTKIRTVVITLTSALAMAISVGTAVANTGPECGTTTTPSATRASEIVTLGLVNQATLSFLTRTPDKVSSVREGGQE